MHIYLPTNKRDIQTQHSIYTNTPSDEVNKFKRESENYIILLSTLERYLSDLNIELQNIFLSSLFPDKIPPRTPSSSQNKVITTDPGHLAALYHYFKNETEWGKNESKKKQDSEIDDN